MSDLTIKEFGMFTLKRPILIISLAHCLLFAPHAFGRPASLPTREDVALFKAVTPKIVMSIPNSVLKQEPKEKLNQVIIAGSDVFDLALAIESGELTNEFKEKLNIIRTEFKAANARLIAESKKLIALKKEMANASLEEKAGLLEKQTMVMLDMFNNMTDPMLNVSVAFKDLNGMLVAKLLQVLELIPPITPYLTVGNGDDKIALSRFMSVKLQEMITYTESLKKIGLNLKATYNELRSDLMRCKNDLKKSYKTVAAQKQLLPNIGQPAPEIAPPAYDDQEIAPPAYAAGG